MAGRSSLLLTREKVDVLPLCITRDPWGLGSGQKEGFVPRFTFYCPIVEYETCGDLSCQFLMSEFVINPSTGRTVR